MFFNQIFKGQITIFAFIVTIVLVILAYVFGQWPVFAVANYYMDYNNISPEMQAQFIETTDFSLLGMSANLTFALMVIIFVFASIGLYVGVKYFHKRDFNTIITGHSTIRWERVIWSFAIWIGLTLLGEMIFYLIEPSNYIFQFELKNFAILFVLVMLFIPLQASFEEWFIRGYLMQFIAFVFGKPWPAIIVTSLLFGGMHIMNPEVQEFGVGTMMFYYVSVALFLAIITVLDDGLELAMGIHIATNVYGSIMVSYEGSVLQTPAIFKMLSPQVGLMTVVFFVSALVFYILANRKYQIGRWWKLNQAIESEPNSTDSLNVG